MQKDITLKAPFHLELSIITVLSFKIIYITIYVACGKVSLKLP